MTTFSQGSNKFYRFAFLYWIAVLAGVFLWSRQWEIVRLASTKQQEDLFGLFGFCVFCVIALVAYIDFAANMALSTKKMLLIGVPFLVSLIFLTQTIELSRKSWDYNQYEAAFRAIVDGANPYLSNRYLYPPFFAEMMAFVFRIGQHLFPVLGLGKSSWVFVFYIHQSSLLFFLLFTYNLSIKFAGQVGLDDLTGMLLVSAIYLFNVPLFRTLSFNQVNFYVLASLLGSLIALRKYPFLAGVSAALGGFIKLYPFALSIPLFGMRKWRALIGILAGSVVFIFFETKFFRSLTLWNQFVRFYLSFPLEQESSLFRNTSPMSFLRNSLSFLGAPSLALTVAFLILILTILTWFAIRFFQRENITLKKDMDFESFCNTGHLLDFSVLSLLIAPSAWEHHYVIAIPLAIWVFAHRGKDALWQVLIAFVLVFGLPVFNIFPFSYLRMVGLILLLILVSPKKIEGSFTI